TLNAVRDQIRSAIDGKDYERAQTLVEDTLRRYPEDHETVGLLGQLHLECGRWDEAEPLFRSLLRVDPESILARSGLALIAEARGDLFDALDQFTLSLEIHPNNQQLAGEVRRLLGQSKRPRLADPRYSKHAVARRLLADGMAGDAVPLFEASLEKALDPTVVALGMAEALWLAGRRREAGDVAAEILAANPVCLKALALRAAAAAAEGESDLSPLLEKAWRLDPDNGVVRRVFESAGLVAPDGDPSPELPDQVEHSPEGEVPELAGRPEEPDGFEPQDLPCAEGDGEWVRDGGVAEPQKPSDREGTEPEEDGKSHLATGLAMQAQHSYDLAAVEFRKALKLDPRLAPEVRIAAQSMVEESPGDPRLRWLAGDALAAEGQLRSAMDQYLKVLEG
ncbi:MAG TPA: tetratricopeptide repeat protein, partial [Chloroflexota bacterium]|nr:tetratricopeptide repeat protein [Chloroflexota bacterium]